jgi:hypothetical protein
LNVLVEATIERDELVFMQSTPAIKKSILAKEKHADMIEGSSPTTRRSSRLMKYLGDISSIFVGGLFLQE